MLGFKWLPVIDADRCQGCGQCVEVCTPGCLALVSELCVLLRPDPCGSEEHCLPACEARAIRMAWVQTVGDPRVGRWRGR